MRKKRHVPLKLGEACPIRHFEGETIVGESHCSPECDADLVRAKYIYRNALIFGPDLRK
jgi:hypothetical protein